MRTHLLVPDLVNRRLICLKNLKILQGSLRPACSITITSISIQDEFTTMIKSRPALITPKFNPENDLYLESLGILASVPAGKMKLL